MTRAPIQRGTCVYDIADPRHYGIVRSLHLVKGKFFANVHWIETGWHSYRVPVKLRNSAIGQLAALARSHSMR